MKKIHMEEKAEKIIKRGEVCQVRMHCFYLTGNGAKTCLCKQRRYPAYAEEYAA